MNTDVQEIFNIQKLQLITDALYAAAGIPSAIITTGGEILTCSGWQDAYVSWSEYGAPILHLKGNFKKRADELGITDMAVSITHEDGMAAAVVIMTGGTNEAAEQR